MKNILRQNINTLICCIVTLILAAFTIYAVLKGSGISLNELIADLRDASLWGLILASIGTLGFIWFEGEALRVIVRHMGYPTNRTQGFVYAAADVYFSAITPSASGGQPASAFFMMQDKIPGTAVMTALLLNLIMYTLAIITIGIADILLFPGIFLNFNLFCRILIIAGGLILTGLGILFYLLLKRQSLILAAGRGITGLLRKLHCRRLADRIERKLASSITKYGQCVAVVFNGKKMLRKVYLLNLCQRLSQIIVTLFSFSAIHGDLRKLPHLLATQIYVVLGSNCVPIPGGMGVTDYLMLNGYCRLMTHDEAFRLEILSRGLSFYICIIVSLIAVIAGYIIRQKKLKMEK